MTPGRSAILVLIALAAACAGSRQGPGADAAPDPAAHVLFVGLESEDAVAVVDPVAGTVIKKVPVGISAEEIEGVHALLVAPHGLSYYVSMAHGWPYGSVWKLATRRDSLIARPDVGFFPATLAQTPDGTWLFVANYNLHGDPQTDTVSIIHTPTMTQVKQIEVCVKPHGLVASHDGTAVYVSCTRDNVVKKISVATLSVVDSTDALVPADQAENKVCYPAGLALSLDDRKLFIACHRHAEVRVMSTVNFGDITNRIAVGEGPYLLQVDPLGRRVWVPNRNAQTYTVIDATSEDVVATKTTSATHPHTFAFGPDGTVYLSMESHAVVPGAIDVIDPQSLETIRSIPVGLQATGVGVVPLPPSHFEGR